jgi:hypothetical protein
MNKHAWGAAALLILAGCGGGSDDSSSTASTPAAAVAQLRTAMSVQQAGPSAAASAADAAEQLLDFAEASFPAFLPSRQTSATLDPFRFRHYPQTGVYVGVVVKPGMGYTMDGVYVMGGPFGEEPVYVGQVSAFITPVDPNPGAGGSTGTNNGCVDLAAYELVGSTFRATYQSTGIATGTSTSEWLSVGPATFEGHQVFESITKMTNETVFEGRTVTSHSEVRSYGRTTGEGEATLYGTVTPPGDQPFPVPGTISSSRTVYDPPFVDRRFSLAPGQSITQTRFGTTISVTQIPGSPVNESRMPINVTTTTTFVGIESVTVPAGTFTTCRYQTSVPGTDPVTTWEHRGSGVMLKFEGPHGTSVATSVTVNGVALTH